MGVVIVVQPRLTMWNGLLHSKEVLADVKGGGGQRDGKKCKAEISESGSSPHRKAVMPLQRGEGG
jgi:hypothetical protein